MNQPPIFDERPGRAPTYRHCAADARCAKCGQSYYTHSPVGREETLCGQTTTKRTLVRLCGGEIVLL